MRWRNVYFRRGCRAGRGSVDGAACLRWFAGVRAGIERRRSDRGDGQHARDAATFFNARIAEKKPGDLVNLTIFRFDDLSTLLIKLGARRDGTYRIVPVTSPTALQKQIYRNWLRN